MKIFDCCMYFDEDLVLDLRLNTLNDFVDYFVIVESNFTHRGEKKNLKFDPAKFKKFKDKIIYLVLDKEPSGIAKINEKDDENTKSLKFIVNAAKRENTQRNFISQGLKNADENDWILISDVDEIPKFSFSTFKNIKEKIILFNQDMFYYKFDLKIPDLIWTGTKACRKKDLINPQWLRNVKDRKYPFYRIDAFFSERKYIDVKIIKDGGWHFTNIKTAEEIENKLKSYLHHREFDMKPLTTEEIQEIMNNKQAIYDLKADQKINKIGSGTRLEKIVFEKLPDYIQQNKVNYERWLD